MARRGGGFDVAFAPSEGLPHRFSPLVLSLTHLIAIGMLAPVMIGALFQLFPVVGGRRLGCVCHIARFWFRLQYDRTEF